MTVMNRRLGLWYTLFSVVAFIVLAFLVVFRLNTTRSLNLQEAQASFRRLHSDIAALLATTESAGRSTDEDGSQNADGSAKPESAGSPDVSAESAAAQSTGEISDSSPRITLGDMIRTYREAVPTVLAVVVFDPERGVRYVWAAEPNLVSFSASDPAAARGFPSFQTSEITQAHLSAPITLRAETTVYVDAVYSILAFSDAYIPLRDSLIAVLAFALLTLVVAIAVGSANRRRDAEEPPRRSVNAPAATIRTVEHEYYQPATHDRADDVPPAALTPPPVERPAAPQRAPAPETHSPSIPPAPEVVHAEPILEEVELEEIAADPGEPGTLFSATTGLSYREHLERRLGLELERAAYNDQDLTCMVIRFDDLGESQEAYVERAQQILSTFQFEDLCFEYDSRSFCVILPNTALPQGLRSAEEFRTRYKGRIVIGLSARNGRLVEAARVLGEASRSMEHALHEPRGIVGFRPDPRKYRQFITGRMGGED
jgi:hypothetical protein